MYVSIQNETTYDIVVERENTEEQEDKEFDENYDRIVDNLEYLKEENEYNPGFGDLLNNIMTGEWIQFINGEGFMPWHLLKQLYRTN